MKATRVVCLVFAAAVATGLSASSSDAKNLNLQNQNHVGHCDVVGNCRPGRTGTSQPVSAQGRPGSIGASGHGEGRISGGHAGGRR
jgi:hypothetical protein